MWQEPRETLRVQDTKAYSRERGHGKDTGMGTWEGLASEEEKTVSWLVLVVTAEACHDRLCEAPKV